MALKSLVDTLVITACLGGLALGTAFVMTPHLVGTEPPTWMMTTACVPDVCLNDDVGAASGNFSVCIDKIAACSNDIMTITPQPEVLVTARASR